MSGLDRMHNASTLVDRQIAAGRAAAPALVAPDGRLSYGELQREVARVGLGLGDLGVRPEERVLLLMDDSAALVSAFLGAMRIGAVPVPVNPYFNRQQYEHFLADSRATAVVADAACLDRIAEPAAAAGAALVVRGGEPGGPGLPFSQLGAGRVPQLAPLAVSPDDSAFWIYTSGTTGAPKGVIHRHAHVAAAAEGHARHVLGMSAADVTLSSAKLSHAYGLSNNLISSLWHGACAVLMEGRPDPARILATLANERATILYVVPAHLRLLLGHLRTAPEGTVAAAAPLRGLRACVSAGERLPGALWHELRVLTGVEALDGIGSSEVLQFYCSNVPGRIRPGSAGVAVPGYELRVVDRRGRAVRPGAVGELIVRGPTVAVGYRHDHARTTERLHGGWFRTGDRMCVDPDGYLWFKGRVDDLLKVNGLWVSPLEIEAALCEHPGVAAAAVVTDSGDQGTELQALVVADPGQAADAQFAAELRDWCKCRLQRHRYPRRISFVEDLPRTLSGKLQRHRLGDVRAAGAPA